MSSDEEENEDEAIEKISKRLRKLKDRIYKLHQIDWRSKTKWDKYDVPNTLPPREKLYGLPRKVIAKKSQTRYLQELREEWRILRKKLSLLCRDRPLAKEIWSDYLRNKQLEKLDSEIRALDEKRYAITEGQLIRCLSLKQQTQVHELDKKMSYLSRQYMDKSSYIRSLIDKQLDLEDKAYFDSLPKIIPMTAEPTPQDARNDWKELLDDPEMYEPIIPKLKRMIKEK